MKTSELDEAETHLSALIEEAAAGEEIIIAKDGTPRVRLVPVSETKSVFAATFGVAKGKIEISDDFDAPLPKETLREWGIE
jgi:prevent-host-death family protein